MAGLNLKLNQVFLREIEISEARKTNPD